MKQIYYPGVFIFLCALFSLDVNCQAGVKSEPQFSMERIMMVENQIAARGITDPNVLAAMRKIERHRFVPLRYRDKAYGDFPLPIGEGQTISQPYIVALMTEVLRLDRTAKVLEIGTGSGYQAAVLAEICDTVFTIEIIDALATRAGALLDSMGYDNIRIKSGDGYQGWEEHAPFDAVIVTCAPTHIPQPLTEQLAEGGKMVIPVGKQSAQELILLTKEKGELKKREIIPVRFVPMLKEGGGEH